MILDGRDDHFPRKRQKPLLEAPGDGDRPLDQCRHFVEERLFDQRRAAGRLRRRRHAGAHLLAAYCKIRHDLGALQARFIRLRRFERYRPRRVESVSDGQPDRWQSPSTSAGTTSSPYKGKNGAVHRADELRVARAPAHAPRDGQRGDGGIHDSREQSHGGGPPLGAAKNEPCPLVGHQPFQLAHRDAAIAGEGAGCLRGRPSGIEGVRSRRSAPFHLPVGRRIGATRPPEWPTAAGSRIRAPFRARCRRVAESLDDARGSARWRGPEGVRGGSSPRCAARTIGRALPSGSPRPRILDQREAECLAATRGKPRPQHEPGSVLAGYSADAR